MEYLSLAYGELGQTISTFYSHLFFSSQEISPQKEEIKVS
jgi:hypothetical protein